MRPRRRPRLDLTADEARADQARLARRASNVEDLRPLAQVFLVAGADVAYANGTAYASVVVLEFPTLDLVDEVDVAVDVSFPYVPGLLAYREGPALLEAFERIERPDVVMFDAAGLAHPRRFGLARHLGYLLDVPSIGVAKKQLCGESPDPGPRRGDGEWIIERDEVVGMAVRTKERVSPVYVSRGWGLSLDDCVRAVLACGAGYRLPEPTRRADAAVGAWKRSRESRAARTTR